MNIFFKAKWILRNYYWFVWCNAGMLTFPFHLWSIFKFHFQYNKQNKLIMVKNIIKYYIVGQISASPILHAIWSGIVVLILYLEHRLHVYNSSLWISFSLGCFNIGIINISDSSIRDHSISMHESRRCLHHFSHFIPLFFIFNFKFFCNTCSS